VGKRNIERRKDHKESEQDRFVAKPPNLAEAQPLSPVEKQEKSERKKLKERKAGANRLMKS